jgi:hypothetical protein
MNFSTCLNMRFSRPIVPGAFVALFHAKYRSAAVARARRPWSIERTLRTSATSCFSLRKRNLNAMASAGSAGWVDCWCCEPRSSRQLKQMCGDLASQWRPRGNFDRLAYFMPNAFRTEQALGQTQCIAIRMQCSSDPTCRNHGRSKPSNFPGRSSE